MDVTYQITITTESGVYELWIWIADPDLADASLGTFEEVPAANITEQDLNILLMAFQELLNHQE